MTSNFVRTSQIFPSLPPRLSGRLMGRLCVKVDEVLWTRKSPGDIIVLIKWWGEFEPTEFRPVDVSKNSRVDAPDTILVYNIRSSLDVVESYLKEVKSLTLNVIDARTRILVGVVTIPDVTAVLFENPYEKYFPIKNCYGNTIGELHFGLKLSYKDKCGKLKTIVPYLKSRKLVSKLVKKRCIKPSAQNKNNVNNSMSEPDPLQETTLVQSATNPCYEEPPIVQPRKVLLSKILEKSQTLRKSIVKNNVPSRDEHVPYTNTSNNASSQPTESDNQLTTHGKYIHYSYGQAGRRRSSVRENGTRATSRTMGGPSFCLANEEEKGPKFSTGVNSKADVLPMAKDSSPEQKEEGVPNRQTVNLLSYTNCMRITCKNVALNNVGLRKVWVSNQNSSCRSAIQRKARSYQPVTFQNVQIQPPGATYFVEYEFPNFLITGKPAKKQKNLTSCPWATKMQRFCSNKQVGNFIQFEQSCIHNLAQSHGDLQEKLKSTTIVFGVFSRHLNQRLPTFIGKAQLRLLDLCQKKFLSQVHNIPIMFSSGLQKCKVHLGSLAVKIELGVDKMYFGPEFARCIKLRLLEERSEDSLSTFPDLSEDKESKPCPVSTVSTSTTDLPKDIPNILQQDILLHGLINISFGRNFDMSRLYLLSRAFWKDDAIISDISYEAEVQNFNFHELIPVLLSKSLLERSRNNFLVTEVRKRNRNGADYLIGMAKLPLHQFYISYRDAAVVDKLLQVKFPVIAVDGWVNVTDPISQNPVGQLKVLLALGTEDQVKSLEQSRFAEFIPNYQGATSYHAGHREVSDGVPTLQQSGTGAKPSQSTGSIENHQEPVQHHRNKKNTCNSVQSLQDGEDADESSSTLHSLEDNTDPVTSVQKVKATRSVRKKRQLGILRAHFRSGKEVKAMQHAENQLSDSVELRSQGVQTDITMASVRTCGKISQSLSPKVQVKENSTKQCQSTMSQTDITNLPDNRFDNQLNTGNQSSDYHIGHQINSSKLLSDNNISNESSNSNRLSDNHIENQLGSSNQLCDNGISNRLTVHQSGTSKQLPDNHVGNQIRSRVSDNCAGNQLDSTNQSSDIRIGNQSDTSNRLSDSRIGNQVGSKQHLPDNHIVNQSDTSNRLSDNRIGNQVGSKQHLPDNHIVNQSDTSNRLSDNRIGNQVGSKQHLPDNHIVNQSDTSNRLSDNRIGNQVGSKQHLPDNHIVNQSDTSNRLSVNRIGNQVGSKQHLPDNHIVNQSDTSNRLSVNRIGNQVGSKQHLPDNHIVNQSDTSNRLSDSHITSRSEKSGVIKTQLPPSGKVPANHMVTVLSAIDNLLDTSKQLSSGLEMHLGAMKTLPLSDNVEIRLNTLNQPPNGHNPRISCHGNKPHYAQDKNSQTATCYSETPSNPSIIPCAPQVVKNPPFFRAHIEIENALHLPGKISDCRRRETECAPGTVDIGSYVTFQFDQGCQNSMYSGIGEMKATHIVHNTVNPSWNWHCDTIIPHFLLTDVSKRLVFKVWQSEGASKCPDTVRDSVLGFAVVDLTVLLFGLPWISGWFNIMDLTGRCNGQIKINITPLENLARFTISNSNDLYKCEQVNGNFQGYEPFPNLNPPNPGSGGDTGGGFGMQDGMDDTVSPSFLSKALKEKFSELDVITLRLKQRLQVVTSDDDISHLEEDETSAIYSNPVFKNNQSPHTKTSSRYVEYQSSHTQTQHYVDSPSLPTTLLEPVIPTALDEPCQGGNSFSAQQVTIEAECSHTNDEDGDVNDFDVLTDYLMESAAKEIELEKVFSAAITKSDEDCDQLGTSPVGSPGAQGSNIHSQVSLDMVETSSKEDDAISVPHSCESAKRLHQEIISQLSGLESRYVRVGANHNAAHVKQSHGSRSTYSHKKHHLSPIESLSGSVHNLSDGGEQEWSSNSSQLDTSNNNMPVCDDSRPSPVGGNPLDETRVSPPAPVLSQASGGVQDGPSSQGKQSVVMNTEEVRRLAQIFSTKRGGP